MATLTRRSSIWRRESSSIQITGSMRFHLAEAYESNNRDAEAKKQIEALMAITPDPKYVAEHKDAIEKAKKLLREDRSTISHKWHKSDT